MKIEVFSAQKNKEIKPMHCAGCGPKQGGPYLSVNATEIFKEMGVPYCRLHDIEYPYGANQFVDIHCVFPDFSADENDDRNYNFSATDKYLLGIHGANAKVFYRLGESIDHYDKKIYIEPPKDFHKWARICEHVIRHYNEGWANGQYLGITHWEIWNEPESRGMWRGTYEEFYELYAVTAKHLKNCFPKIKVGGYSCVGFYSATKARTDDWYYPWFDTIVPFMDGFFNYIDGKNVPLDFFSWHCYAFTPEEVGDAARFIRKYLDDKGYTQTESYLTEFNMYYQAKGTSLYQETPHAADVLALMIEGQNSPLDMMFYYDLRYSSRFNNMFYVDKLDLKMKKLPAFYSMQFFNFLYELGEQIKIEYEQGKGLYVLGAAKNSQVGVAISSKDYDGEVEMRVNADKVTLIVASPHLKVITKGIEVENNLLHLKVEKERVYYLSFTEKTLC